MQNDRGTHIWNIIGCPDTIWPLWAHRAWNYTNQPLKFFTNASPENVLFALKRRFWSKVGVLHPSGCIQSSNFRGADSLPETNSSSPTEFWPGPKRNFESSNIFQHSIFRFELLVAGGFFRFSTGSLAAQHPKISTKSRRFQTVW